MKQNPNNSNSNSNISQVINSVTNVPSNSSKSGRKNKKHWKKVKCRFCESAEHTSTKCTKYLTPESRIAILRSRHGSEVCHKCTLKHTDVCKKIFWGYCTFNKSCKSSPHQFSIYPIKCKTLATKLTNPTLIENVVALPIQNINVLEKAKLQKA